MTTEDQKAAYLTASDSALRRQYEVAKQRNARLPDTLSLAPRTPEGRKANGYADLP